MVEEKKGGQVAAITDSKRNVHMLTLLSTYNDIINVICNILTSIGTVGAMVSW